VLIELLVYINTTADRCSAAILDLWLSESVHESFLVFKG
jgi:hypothetical protein